MTGDVHRKATLRGGAGQLRAPYFYPDPGIGAANVFRRTAKSIESERREDDRPGARDSRSATRDHLAGVTSGAACEGGCRSIVAIHLGMVLKFACRSWGVSPAYQSRLSGSLK